MKVVGVCTVHGIGDKPIPPGEEFNIPDDDPGQLLSRGIVKPTRAAKALADTEGPAGGKGRGKGKQG